MKSIELVLSAKLELQCRAWCRRWFPDEAYGLLLGTFAGCVAHVDEIWTPSINDCKKCFKADKVLVQSHWILEALESVEEDGLMVVGDFHSHPYLKNDTRVDPVQSVGDVACSGGFPVYGICNVEQQKSGRLITRLKWWGPSVRVDRRTR